MKAWTVKSTSTSVYFNPANIKVFALKRLTVLRKHLAYFIALVVTTLDILVKSVSFVRGEVVGIYGDDADPANTLKSTMLLLRLHRVLTRNVLLDMA